MNQAGGLRHARRLRAEHYRRMPWKNGGGETTEIAVFPTGAGLDAFDWRVSMARVAADGPFSRFPGVERMLTLLEGNGLTLAIAGRPPVTLTVASQPLAFDADAVTTADLVEGPVVDLNVMSRRGRVSHAVTPIDVADRLELTVAADAALLFCRSGEASVTTDTAAMRLGAHDGILVEDGAAGVWTIVASPSAKLILIEFTTPPSM